MLSLTKTAIIFDMDGVLVDSEPVIESAAIAGLKEYGIHALSEDFKPFIGAGEDRYIGGVAEKYGVPYKLEMKDRVYQIYLDIVSSKLKVYDGTNELLNRLKSDNQIMALASSADRVKVEANLHVAKIPLSYFDAIICGEDVVSKKPSPEIYQYTAHKLAIPEEQCIVIEDAINGIRAAKAANMKCIALTTSFPSHILREEKPDSICSSIREVYPIIHSLSF